MMSLAEEPTCELCEGESSQLRLEVGKEDLHPTVTLRSLSLCRCGVHGIRQLEELGKEVVDGLPLIV